MLYRYRLYSPDGDEAGEAHYAVRIEPNETIWTGDGRKLRVLDVVPVDDSESPGALVPIGFGLELPSDAFEKR
jgi:hypothetical protein